MKRTFLDFVNEKSQNDINVAMLNEAFKAEEMDKAIELIDSLLKKHIDGLVPLVGMVDTVIGDKKCTSKQYMVIDKEDPLATAMFQLNWLNSGKSTEVYSIDFFKDCDIYWSGKAKSSLSIMTLGTSVVYFLPIIWEVINSKNYQLSQKNAEKYAQSVFKESKFYVGGIEYTIVEGASDVVIENAFLHNINEANGKLNKDAIDFKNDIHQQAKDAHTHRNDSPAAKEKSKRLNDEYRKIVAAIKGGAETVEDLKLAIKHNVQVTVEVSKTIKDNEEQLSERKDPDQVFKEMQKYVKMVIRGLQPSLIICGAPGVGKTYKVKKQLKANAYFEDHNMMTIKGKCTPRRLYLSLYDMKDKGNILLIDDADALVGPKAPEDCINILKAALDSTADDEGRLVTYGIAGKILDDDGVEIPKKFYYNGGVIVLTNYTAGQLDTALRGRSFIQDIHFTTQDILDIIKKLLPDIDPHLYSMKSKEKAYNYLEKLSKDGSEMEISLRTFGLCAKLYQTAEGDSDFTDSDVESMIREQMRMQALRGGKKY